MLFNLEYVLLCKLDGTGFLSFSQFADIFTKGEESECTRLIRARIAELNDVHAKSLLELC